MRIGQSSRRSTYKTIDTSDNGDKSTGHPQLGHIIGMMPIASDHNEEAFRKALITQLGDILDKLGVSRNSIISNIDSNITLKFTQQIGTITDNGSKLNVNGLVLGTKFYASSTSAIATLHLSGNSNSNGTAGLRRVVRYIPTVSSGTRTTIPIVSQSSAWCQSFIKVYGYSAGVNWNGNPYYFEAKMAMTHLTSFVGFASWGVVGNISSITTSATEIYLNHSSAYTQTSSNGLYIVIEYSSNDYNASINIGGIVLN